MQDDEESEEIARKSATVLIQEMEVSFINTNLFNYHRNNKYNITNNYGVKSLYRFFPEKSLHQKAKKHVNYEGEDLLSLRTHQVHPLRSPNYQHQSQSTEIPKIKEPILIF